MAGNSFPNGLKRPETNVGYSSKSKSLDCDVRPGRDLTRVCTLHTRECTLHTCGFALHTRTFKLRMQSNHVAYARVCNVPSLRVHGARMQRRGASSPAAPASLDPGCPYMVHTVMVLHSTMIWWPGRVGGGGGDGSDGGGGGGFAAGGVVRDGRGAGGWVNGVCPHARY